MMNKLIIFVKKYPLFILLLPVFFVLHGLIENYNPALIKDALELALIYIVISLAIAGLFWLFYKDIFKACILTFVIMTFNLFFGSIHDMIKKYFADSFTTRYTFIIPFVLILFLLLVIYLKRSKKNFNRATLYLNCLLLLLIIMDIVALVRTVGKRNAYSVTDLSGKFIDCITCPKPDIYLVIADEYPGKEELEKVFSFDNSAFENELRKRGFHIVNNSMSNYNATYYSIASMLSMDYIHNLESNFVNHRDLLTCGSLVNDNNVINFFKKEGYSFYNHSFFELANKERAVFNPFYSTKKKLITSQTFINRFIKEAGYNFLSSSNVIPGLVIDSLARKTADIKSPAPKFVYAHLDMPHHPYYFDKDGKPAPPDRLEDHYKLNKPAFLEYLLYTNKLLLELTDHIKKVSATPPIIILMSDHGFRQFTDSAYNRFHFSNLNSVFLPDQNYSAFYEGMSNVNEFRVLLNSQFGQKLPMLKDSTSFLKE